MPLCSDARFLRGIHQAPPFDLIAQSVVQSFRSNRGIGFDWLGQSSPGLGKIPPQRTFYKMHYSAALWKYI